jgi:hypothetical protein
VDDDRTPAQATGPAGDHAIVEHYEIRVGARLSTRWSAWFDGLTLTNEDDGTTVIAGPVVDQAALHGLLQRLRDLGTPLLSLARTTPDEPAEHPVGLEYPNHTDSTGAHP